MRRVALLVEPPVLRQQVGTSAPVAHVAVLESLHQLVREFRSERLPRAELLATEAERLVDVRMLLEYQHRQTLLHEVRRPRQPPVHRDRLPPDDEKVRFRFQIAGFSFQDNRVFDEVGHPAGESIRVEEDDAALHGRGLRPRHHREGELVVLHRAVRAGRVHHDRVVRAPRDVRRGEREVLADDAAVGDGPLLLAAEPRVPALRVHDAPLRDDVDLLALAVEGAAEALRDPVARIVDVRLVGVLRSTGDAAEKRLHPLPVDLHHLLLELVAAALLPVVRAVEVRPLLEPREAPELVRLAHVLVAERVVERTVCDERRVDPSPADDVAVSVVLEPVRDRVRELVGRLHPVGTLAVEDRAVLGDEELLEVLVETAAVDGVVFRGEVGHVALLDPRLRIVRDLLHGRPVRIAVAARDVRKIAVRVRIDEPRRIDLADEFRARL